MAAFNEKPEKVIPPSDEVSRAVNDVWEKLKIKPRRGRVAMQLTKITKKMPEEAQAKNIPIEQLSRGRYQPKHRI